LGLTFGWKDSPPSLGDCAYSSLFKKLYQVTGEKPVKGLAQETPIGSKMREELGHGSDIGQIAASLAGDT
jgi:hypothetical protein